MAKTGATTYSISFYQKDGAFTSDRTVDLNGKNLLFSYTDYSPIEINLGVTVFKATDPTDDFNVAEVTQVASPISAESIFRSRFNGFVKEAKVVATADATTATLAYTADTHTFNGATVLDDLSGNGAGVVAVDNAGLLSWSAAGGSFGYPQILLAQVFS